MLCFRFPEGHRSPRAPKKVKCYLLSTEETQRGKEKRILPGAAEKEVRSQSALLDILCYFCHLHFFENLAPCFILFIQRSFFGKILYQIFRKFCTLWPWFICNLQRNFWNDKVGLKLHILSQHLKMGNQKKN